MHQNIDPTTALPLLLPVAGAIFQFTIRQFKSVPDPIFYLIAVSLATGVYAIVTPSLECADWRNCIVDYLAWMAVHFTSLVGGTALASNAAKGVAASNPKLAANNVFIPLTNSK